MLLALAWWARGARIRRARRWSAELGRMARGTNRTTGLVVAMAGLAAMLALAGPRFGRQTVTTDTQALDLVIAVDISRSMLAEDVAPSRLDRARNEVRRLIHDLSGDRIGLVAFAGRSFILSPLTIDGGALHLLVDALHPDLASAGGTDLQRALRQGAQLLRASDRVADRVLVVFTDGEAHDSLPVILEAAEALERDGIRLVLVGEGVDAGASIPVPALDGSVEYHRDEAGDVVLTRRRDDVLTAVADAGRGALVAAQLDDQAGAVRELLLAYKRAPESSSAAAHDIPRGWIPVLVAALLLLSHGVTRRTAALAGVIVMAAGPAAAQGPRNAAEAAWRDGRFQEATERYLEQARAGAGGDTAWYNAGTALLARGMVDSARTLLERAAASLDPELRFRALYNLGLGALRRAAGDSAQREQHLAEARQHYREALLLAPHDADAKWNLELAITPAPPPRQGSGRAPPPPSAGGGGPAPPAPPAMSSLTREQAQQILESIAAEERETRLDVTRRSGQLREGRREKDW